MNFYNLKSIIAAQKQSFQMKEASPSFYHAPPRNQPYIQPTFTKEEFEGERPAVVLVSAVGATGKTTLAQVLSNETADLPRFFLPVIT